MLHIAVEGLATCQLVWVELVRIWPQVTTGVAIVVGQKQVTVPRVRTDHLVLPAGSTVAIPF